MASLGWMKNPNSLRRPISPGCKRLLAESAERMAAARDTRRTAPITRPGATSNVPLVEWVDRPTADYPFGTIKIVVGRETAYYVVHEIECQFADFRGFHLGKESDPNADYHVCLSMTNPQDHSCDCQGFLAHGHCKHIAAAILIAQTPKPAADCTADDYRNKSHSADPMPF